MPTLNHRSDGGWFVRAYEGAIVTYQLSHQGVAALHERQIKDRDAFPKWVLAELLQRGWAYSGGIGGRDPEIPPDFDPIVRRIAPFGSSPTDVMAVEDDEILVRHLVRPEWGVGVVVAVKQKGRKLLIDFGPRVGTKMFIYPLSSLQFLPRASHDGRYGNPAGCEVSPEGWERWLDRWRSTPTLVRDPRPQVHLRMPIGWHIGTLLRVDGHGGADLDWQSGPARLEQIGDEFEVRFRDTTWVPWSKTGFSDRAIEFDVPSAPGPTGAPMVPPAHRTYVRVPARPEWGTGTVLYRDDQRTEAHFDALGCVREFGAPYDKLAFLTWTQLVPGERPPD